MVVVIVADQHEVDRRQLGKGDARRVDALRPGEGEGRDALRPDRVGQDVEPGRLDQQRGMADHGEPQPGPVDPRCRLCLRKRARIGRRPFRALAAQLPFQKIGKAAGRLAVRG